MTHLHIADGVLPVPLWLAGLLLAGGIVALVSFRHRNDRADRLALLGALAAVMLAAMAVPLGPFGHLGFAPVVGILLGPGLGFVAALLVNAILALLGHGGITVVGLNACVLGAGTALARPLYRAARARFAPGRSAAIAAVGSGLASVLALWVVLALAGLEPAALAAAEAGHDAGAGHEVHAAVASTARFFALASPFWALGLAGEAVLSALAVGFVARVQPGLLP
jgi:cobalt/nickel transport system permease protein